MLTEEQKLRLNPEQLTIAEQWEQESKARLACLDEMEAASKLKDTDTYQAAFVKYTSIGNHSMCPHERSIWSSCGACDEISRLLNPELFCSKCEEAFDTEDINLCHGICDYCSQQDE